MEHSSGEPAAAKTASLEAGQSVKRESVAGLPIDVAHAAIAATAYIALQVMVIRLRILSPVVLSAATFVSLLVTLFYAVALARSLRTIASQISVLLVTAVVVLPFVLLQFVHVRTPQQLAFAREVVAVYSLLFRAVPGLRGIMLISFAVAVGVAVSRLVREIKLLLPVAIVLALVDLYVVFGGGLVAQANNGNAPAAQAAMRSLTVTLTPRPAPGIHAPQPLAVGFADFLFIALFFACFARFRVPARRTFVLLCSILCLYMLAVMLGHIDLPALVPIAFVVIGSNISAFRYQRDEAFAMLYAGIVVIGILAALVIMTHR